MIKTYIYGLCLLVLLGGTLLSCSNDDDKQLFPESPSERLSAREQELKDALLSSETGWKTIYFTNNERFGGFTLLMNFSEDGTLEMTSDIDDDTAVKSSRYDLNLGATNKLTFSTKNHIHKLNDSKVPKELEGTGYMGDNEMSFYGEKDGKLYFKTVRSETDVVFEKASAEDWNNLVAQNKEMINNMISGPEDPVYQVIKITRAGNSSLYNFNYNTLTRFVKSVTPTDDNKLIEKSFGVGFTPEGLVLDPPLAMESEEFTDFTWNEEDRKFVSQTEKTTAEIIYSNEPAYINNDYKDIGATTYSLTYRGDITDNALANSLNSTSFKTLIDEINESLTKKNSAFKIDRIALVFNLKGKTDPKTSSLLLVRVAGSNCNYNIQYTYKNKKVVFTYNGPRNGNGSFFENDLKPDLIDLICSPEGFYVNKEGRFESRYTNPAYSLTSAKDARFRILTQGNYYSNE